jgi:hypothetical protein
VKSAAKTITLLLWLLIAALQLCFSAPAASAKSLPSLENRVWKIFVPAAQSHQANPSQVTEAQRERPPPTAKNVSGSAERFAGLRRADRQQGNLVTGEHVRIIMRFDVRFPKRYDLDVVVKPSQLRANLYRLLDRVLRTGEPIEIDRAGKKLLLVPKEKRSRLNNLVRRDVIVGNPEDLVHLDWSKEWKGDLP